MYIRTCTYVAKLLSLLQYHRHISYVHVCMHACFCFHFHIICFYLEEPPHKAPKLDNVQLSIFNIHGNITPSTTVSTSHPPTPSRYAMAKIKHYSSEQGSLMQESNASALGTWELVEATPHSTSPSPPSPSKSLILSPSNAYLGQSQIYSTPLPVIHKTPKKDDDIHPTTPSSVSKYKRVLDLSGASLDEESPESSRRSILKKFDAVYQDLTSQTRSIVDEETIIDDKGGHNNGVLGGLRPHGGDHSHGPLTRIPACPHMTVTGSDGKRVYLRLHHDKVSYLAMIARMVNYLLSPLEFLL